MEATSNMGYSSTKVYDGFSTVFRQWKAEGTHCKYLHGYGVSFKVFFEGELDDRNWVFDFGGMKRAKTLIDGKQPKEWLDWLLDHTVIIAEDDPELEAFEDMDAQGIIQLRVLPATGAERFAEYLFKKLNAFVQEETQGRVRVVKIEFREHEKNNAIYEENQ
jgi:6-pyruvoyltetrahydropterin/6-carboxytetrahydropterin synthase